MEEFESLVKEAIQLIPGEFLAKLKNVAIVTQELPSEYQVEKLKLRQGMLLGLFEKTTYLPDKITIFKKPIETMARLSGKDLKKIIADTVKHEVGHHFGMNETRVRKALAKNR